MPDRFNPTNRGVANKIERLISGLKILRSYADDFSFYNSTGGDMVVHCDPLPSSDDILLLKELGWARRGDTGNFHFYE